MKKLKLMLVAAMAVTCFSAIANANNYDRGFRDGVLASSAGLFTSEVVDKHHVYLGADDDAAMYLAEGGQPSAILSEAMDIERNFLLDNNYVEANYMDSEDLAYMVMGRAAQLK